MTTKNDYGASQTNETQYPHPQVIQPVPVNSSTQYVQNLANTQRKGTP